ncbi:putative Prephenate dehydrogenase [Dioszegia hungarica]|uniref:Prephenate dehydrogenase [NADP(+)] n=1 Tax=Dioszegia hungarica TaxID=4972 RepID=A0AA38LSQ3_9TREE|nr:putative Prephenate dehydrogenase [Dioszegia hungarica]KAI9636087.1 putative Prephenate dehydrogenase [Dioszegia hungarica]
MISESQGSGSRANGAVKPVIGIIGMGDMGRMYARRLHAGGAGMIYVCDLPEKYSALQEEFADTGIIALPDGHAVSRLSDFIVYSVEAAHIGACVKEYGPSTKVGATVAGQTSVKAPEKQAFETYLPQDCAVVSLHSLHGPGVTTEGQPLIIIHHRGPKDRVTMVEDIFRCFKSRYVYLSYEEHDMVTANTQAVTHAAFLSMGTAWHKSSAYPWETTRYVSGVEVVKVNITLRIYSAKWHVYAGLAILNPAAQAQIQQYARSASELFKLMVQNKGDELGERVWGAREKVFGWTRDQEGGGEGEGRRGPILLSEDVLDQFSLGKAGGAEKERERSSNSHLSLLAMVDCWAKLGIRPYEHLDVAGTPVFMLWIGVAEYLFRSPALLTSSIQAALSDRIHRPDDIEFVVAARGWSECVTFGNFDLYRTRFEETAAFFAPRFEEATKLGSKMIKVIQDAQRAKTETSEAQ